MTDDDNGLAGISDCGCVTAALSLSSAPTKKELREFYQSMADTGREVRRLSNEEIRKRLFECTHEKSAA